MCRYPEPMDDEHPTDDDLARAWASVIANTPMGWIVGTPGNEGRYHHWSQFNQYWCWLT